MTPNQRVNMAELYPCKADYYRDGCGKLYEEPKSSGFATIPVLNFLWGKPWDDLALRWVHAVRPFMIRVTTGEVTTDAVHGRVTVYLKDDRRTINWIEQAVTVAGSCGADLIEESRKQYGDNFLGTPW